MTKTSRLAAAFSLAAIFLSACASQQQTLPSRLPTMKAAAEATALRFAGDAGSPGIVHVPVPAGMMRIGTVHNAVSSGLRAREVRIMVPSSATMADIVEAIQSMGITVVFKWRNGDKTDILNKKPPFTRFSGNFGGLLDALRRGAGVVSWEENGTVFISDADRFSVTMPQDKDLIAEASGSLQALGATDIVTSVEAGTIVYTATPDLQTDVIGPFFSKLVRNLSTVNLQVAIVSLAVNDKMKSGFDWNAFSVAIQEEGAGTPSNSGAGAGTDGTVTPTDTVTGGLGGSQSGDSEVLDNAVKILSSGLAIGTTSTGEIFGRTVMTSVAAAIDFLSSFGNTNVTQHVDLRTISGKPVEFYSGQEIPYVKGVSSTTTSGTDNTTGSTDTDSVKTGLTVEMTPRFDSSSGIVTVSFDLDLTSVVEFVQLSAGNQIGTLTQPRTQSQKLSDIVRLRAGQTVVLGGLQYDQEQYNGTEPALLRGALRDRSLSVGSRSQDTQRQALFVILRPVVTIYDSQPGVGALAEALTK